MQNTISNITFIGSGISTSFSILNFLDLINNEVRLDDRISINIIEKYSEFNLGIPYGSRSGFSTLLITSLENFLIEPELTLFIDWLNKNKTSLLDKFEKEGGSLSKKWLTNNEEAIRNNKWKKLFIPRRFFGCYINSKINDKINKLTDKGLITTNFIQGEVIDLEEINDSYKILLSDGSKINSKKVILSTGSLPVNQLWKNEELIEKENLMFINNPYKPELGIVLNKINKYLDKRINETTNILIVGANASALELIYKINDYTKESYRNTNFTFLSSQGRIPDAVVDEERKKNFIPKHLEALKKEEKLTAKLINEATIKDIDVADKIKLGPASTVNIISKYFGTLLKKLDTKELEIFAYKYGNEIGKRQRCAGEHYTSIVNHLEKQNRFEHISGRFSDMQCDNIENYSLLYLDSLTKKEKLHNKPFHIVINCIGGKNLNDEDIPQLHKNLIKKNYCIPNKSKIGFHVNEALEARKNLHIMGPMLAGNVIENKAVWHIEHCGRIIWISKILSKIIFNDLNKTKTHTPKDYTLEVNNLDSQSDIEKYNTLLEKNWDNNIYYAYDHLKYFKEDLNLLKYFLLKINGTPTVLMPIVLMPIILNERKSEYYDAITPYGYNGPLYNNDSITKLGLEKFWEAVDIWYKNNNVITEFTRFSLNDNHLGYSGLLMTSLLNVKGVLRDNFEDQWNAFLSKVRNNYRKATSNNLSIKVFCRELITNEAIQIFFDIYTKTMVRNNAKTIYYFSLDYFKSLIKNNINQFLIAIVYLGETPISTELIIKNNNTLFAFLGGTDADYFYSRPNDYLRVEIIKWAIAHNFKHYVLGGGLKDGDGLYKSKKSFFPKDIDIPFFTGRKVINNKVYNNLIKQVEYNCNHIDDLIQNTDTFFPVYRINNEKTSTFTFDVISSKDDWKKSLDSVKNYDFYHTYDYHNLSKGENEKAVLLRYSEEDKIICLPVIIRKIEGTEYCDITSVYGYSGPVQKNIDSSFDNSNFLKGLNTFFEEHKIVSVFSRLNPFINNQESILNNLGEVITIGNVVNIDITKDIDTQRTNFSKTTKRHLNKAKKYLEIKISRDKKDIVVFINLYYENMDRVKAEEKYYFTEEYFHKLINSTDYETDVLFAINKETKKIISAATMIKTNNIIQYHLSGTKSSFLNLSPVRLLIDEMRIRGTKEKYTYFNLGGGLGNNDDELFRFKSSFSKDFKSFKIWKYIVNQSVYDKLVKEKTTNQESTFFPLYRG